MWRSKIGQEIIPCIQLTSLSSAGREMANEVVKRKYLTRNTEPLSFPEWNVAVGDNQVNKCLNFKICMLDIGCLVLTAVSSSLSLSHQFKVNVPGTSSSPSTAKTGTAPMVGRTPMSRLQCGWALLAQRTGPPCHPEGPLLSEERQPGCCRLHDAVSSQPGLSTQIQPFRGSLLLPWHPNFWLPRLPSSQMAVILESMSGAIRSQSSLTAPASWQWQPCLSAPAGLKPCNCNRTQCTGVAAALLWRVTLFFLN